MSREPDGSGPTDRLPGETELSRLHRDEAEPPVELDQRILAASRRAVGAGPQRHRPSRARWTASLAVAAVLVLAVTLVSLMPREQLGPVPEPSPPERQGSTAPSLDEATDPPAARSLYRAEEPLPATAPVETLDQDRAAKTEGEQRERGQILESDSIERSARPAASGATTLDPEPWRRRIEALLELGDYAQAGRELAAFRARYPDYPPGELERRLQELTE